MDFSTYGVAVASFLASQNNALPWAITGILSSTIAKRLTSLPPEFRIRNDIAIHRDAHVEEHVIIKSPAIIGAGCFIGSHAYLRGGVWLHERTTVGPGCEIKSSVILTGTALAHFNFVGDSIVGAGVNMEAGSVIANHYNEREDKMIDVLLDGQRMATGSQKFGALVGDYARIGANAVLSPGTMLTERAIVKRLELVQQL